MTKKTPKILIIAGSDSGGGAGIQADIKTVTALGGYAATAITSITAQNTMGVQGISDVPLEMVRRQIAAVLEDIGADVIKTGMLSSKEVVDLVAAAIDKYKIDLVLDPVMLSKSRAKLLRDDALESLKNRLIPKAFLLTPNIPEAEIISGMKISSIADMEEAAKKIIGEYKCAAVLVKGGHLAGKELTDVLVRENGNVMKIKSKRIETSNTHGTGCTYASAIATFLAKGLSLETSVKKAHKYLYKAISKAEPIGRGISPVNHAIGIGNFDLAGFFRGLIYFIVITLSLIRIVVPMIQDVLK